jgi:hypothetical protein
LSAKNDGTGDLLEPHPEPRVRRIGDTTVILEAGKDDATLAVASNPLDDTPAAPSSPASIAEGSPSQEREDQ